MLAIEFIRSHKIIHKNRASFHKKINRNPKVKYKKRIKSINDFFKKTSKAELLKAWNEITNPLN